MATIASPRQVTADGNRKTDTASLVMQPNVSPALISQKFDLAIALTLSSWSALSVAVENEWGGPDSADKRDWLAGAISDLFSTTPETDEQDVEEMLLQVLADEFDLQLEDESEVQVASDILKARKLTLEGNFLAVDQLYEKWAERQKKGERRMPVHVQEREDEVDDEDSVSESTDEDDRGGIPMEVDTSDAPPQLIAVGKKPEPEIDEEGFTKVTSKKRR